MPSINVSMIPHPPASSASQQLPPISGIKWKKQDPHLHPKANKLANSDPGVDVHEVSDANSQEIYDFDIEGAIPEDFIPQTESSHMALTPFQILPPVYCMDSI